MADRRSPKAELDRICDNVRMTRRMVVTMLLASAGAGVAANAQERLQRAAAANPQFQNPFGKDEEFRVVRPDDMLILYVRMRNLRLEGPPSKQRLVRINPGQQARLIVEHQPQAIAEEAFQQIAGQPIPPTTREGLKDTTPQKLDPQQTPAPPSVAQSRIAGRSRVVFAMPSAQASLDWTLEGLLQACETWPMSLDYAARPAPVAPSTMSDPGVASSVLKRHLDSASQALNAKLPADQQAALAAMMPAASARVGAAMTAAARRGQPMSEGEIDQMIAQELQAGFGRGPGPGAALAPARSREHHLIASRALEAAAAGFAVDAAAMAQGGSPSPRRTAAAATDEPEPTPAPPPARPAPSTLRQQPPPTVFRPTPQTVFRPAPASPTGGTPVTPPNPPPQTGAFAPPPARPAGRTVAPQPSPPPPRGAPQPAVPTAQPPAGNVFTRTPAPFQTPTLTGPASGFVLDASVVQMMLKPHPPAQDVTAIELPYRLIQSPLATGGWRHAHAPVLRGARTELWHTRLGTRVAGGVNDRSPEPLRAIWSDDYPEPQSTTTEGWALDGADRRMLVKLTAGYDENSPLQTIKPIPFTPVPSQAKRLMLTALGGWLDLDGHWEDRPPGVDLEAWNHKTAMARDYYVRVVYAGFLFPFGHRASLVKVTERKFETQQDGGGRVAILRQRYFIIVREQTRTYPGENQAFAGRDLPFRQVDIMTRITPDLAKPGSSEGDRLIDSFYGPAALYREAFFPITAANTDFLFQMVGINSGGRRTAFSAPLMFVSENHNKPSSIGVLTTKLPDVPGIKEVNITSFYARSLDHQKRLRSRIPMNGAVIQFAPQTIGGDDKGDTNIPTDFITFRGGKSTAGVQAYSPQFYPGSSGAEVTVPALKRLLGGDKPAKVSFSGEYLKNGFVPSQAGQLFLDIAPGGDLKVEVSDSKPSDKFGGIVSPGLQPSALSRHHGVVAGANNASAFQNGMFQPGDFLPNDAKLLGIVKLNEILKAVDTLKNPGQAPKLNNLELPDRIEASFSLTQDINSSPVPLFVPRGGCVLKIESKNIVYFDPAKSPVSTVDGSLTKFKINLFGFIILSFDKLSFAVRPGKKTDVSVDMDVDNGVLFGGPLEFVNKLKDFIPSDGFGDGSALAVTPKGISASYSLGLPTVQVGILSLQNISLGAGFSLPLTGGVPSVRFNFAERQNPFNLTVSLFGGGGFFAITVDAGGVREVEAALEFGAQISIDLGVASGGVYVKGGFYFHWRDAPDELIVFEGYVELGGHLSIICIITVSLVFHLALTYEKSGGKSRFYGQATLTVEVEILFFSVSVGVHVEKEFGGSNADPKFIDFIPDDATWRQYCSAFA